MTLGAEFSDLAVEEITNGELWTHSATFTYGPRRQKTNPWDEATDAAAISPQTLQVAAFPVEKAIEEGGVKRSMWSIIVPAATLIVPLTEEDTVSLSGVVEPISSVAIQHEIVSVSPIGANNVSAVYEILALR